MRFHRFGTALAAGLVLVPSLLAQSAEADFHHAYFLERERGHLEEALALYREVARSTEAGAPLQLESERRARGVEEDLVAVDLARLMPPASLAYVELVQPGAALLRLLEGLGLARNFDEAVREGRFAVSPELVRGLLGLRSAAVALTAVPNGGGAPEGVLVLHTGEEDVLRGLLETVVLAQGIPGAALGDVPTWSLAGTAEVALSARLCIVASARSELEAVLARLEGRGGPSLAEAPGLARALAARADGPLFACVQGAALRPLIAAQLANVGTAGPLAAAALDVEHFEGAAVRLALSEQGLGLDGELFFANDHRSLAFNLLRTAPLDPRTLELVPRGAAAFLATALNERGPALAPLHANSDGVAAVSALDLPRELFANLCGLALYVLPGSGPLPEAALALSSNDPERTAAVLGLGLGLVNQLATGRGLEGQEEELAGVPATLYRLPPGLPLYVARAEHQLLVSPSAELIERALAGQEKGQSILRDEAFASELGRLERDTTFAFSAHLGRLAEVARPYVGDGPRAELERLAPLVAETVVGLRASHGDARLAFSLSVTHLPLVDALVSELLMARRLAEVAVQEHAALLASQGEPR